MAGLFGWSADVIESGRSINISNSISYVSFICLLEFFLFDFGCILFFLLGGGRKGSSTAFCYEAAD